MTQGQNAVVNGHSLYYEQMGMGQPLVLLHGGLNTIDSSFSQQFSDFARQYRVTAIEQVGHGRSPMSNSHSLIDKWRKTPLPCFFS